MKKKIIKSEGSENEIHNESGSDSDEEHQYEYTEEFKNKVKQYMLKMMIE